MIMDNRTTSPIAFTIPPQDIEPSSPVGATFDGFGAESKGSPLSGLSPLSSSSSVVVSQRRIPTNRAGRAKMKKETRQERNRVAIPRAMAGVKKKLALPPITCVPRARPLIEDGRAWEIKEEAGAWYVPPTIPMAIKKGTICQKARVKLTPIPVNEIQINPRMMISRRLNLSAKIARGTCPIP
jgi:hypothetical protein